MQLANETRTPTSLRSAFRARNSSWLLPPRVSPPPHPCPPRGPHATVVRRRAHRRMLDVTKPCFIFLFQPGRTTCYPRIMQMFAFNPIPISFAPASFNSAARFSPPPLVVRIIPAFCVYAGRQKVLLLLPASSITGSSGVFTRRRRSSRRNLLKIPRFSIM